MLYRKGTSDDCKAVYALICDMESKALPYGRFEAIYLDEIKDHRYYCLICEQNNAVIGALNLRVEEQLHHAERIAEILEFAVASAYRNKGIGKEMLTQGFRIAKDNGCAQMEVACNQLRSDTHRFYMREGMHNFHFKFSKRLVGADAQGNMLGR